MSWLKDFKFLRVIPLVALFYAVPALAQFEVAPDHFDSSANNNAARKPAAKSKASVAQPAVSLAAHRSNEAMVAKAGRKHKLLRSTHSAAAWLPSKTNGVRTSKAGRTLRTRGQSDPAAQVAKASLSTNQRD